MQRALRASIVAFTATVAAAAAPARGAPPPPDTHAVAIVMHKDHANLQFFNGAALAERFPELEGTGRGVRHLRFRYRYPVDEELVHEVVHACVELMELSPRTGPGALTEEH